MPNRFEMWVMFWTYIIGFLIFIFAFPYIFLAMIYVPFQMLRFAAWLFDVLRIP